MNKKEIVNVHKRPNEIFEIETFEKPLRTQIAELQEENKQLEEQHDLLIDEFQKERENLCKQIKQESDARERFVEKVKQLKEQLAEKNKEIDKLTRRLNLTTKYKDDQKERVDKYYDKIKQIRKQVCDEIREECEIFEAGPIGKLGYIIRCELLDKIEKGE